MSENTRKRICPGCGYISVDGTAICPNDSLELKFIPDDPFIGKIVADRYKVLSQLGSGGMSVVYKARHQFMERFVAIKMLRTELEEDSDSLKRLEIESKAISALKHPGIVPVYDFGKLEDGTPYLVMEFLEGKDLSHLLKQKAPMNFKEALPIFVSICEALSHAHKNGVIHRDIKPSNIILTRSRDKGPDVPVIVDFGIAKMLDLRGEELNKLTATGQVFGSPLYMSPEQCNAKKPDARSDIYAVGCALYQALTGELPVKGNTPFDTMIKHIQESPKSFHEVLDDSDIPTKVELCVFKAMEKDPDHRFPSMDEFSLALSNCLEAPSQPGSSYRTMKLEGVEVEPVAPASSSLSSTNSEPAKKSAEFAESGFTENATGDSTIQSSGGSTIDSGKYGAIAIISLLLVAGGVTIMNILPKGDSSSSETAPRTEVKVAKAVEEPTPKPVVPATSSVARPEPTSHTAVTPAAVSSTQMLPIAPPVKEQVVSVQPRLPSRPAIPTSVGVAPGSKSYDSFAVARIDHSMIINKCGAGWRFQEYPESMVQELVGPDALARDVDKNGTVYYYEFLYRGQNLEQVSDREFDSLRRRVGRVKVKRVINQVLPIDQKFPSHKFKLDILEYMNVPNPSSMEEKNPRTYVIYFNRRDAVGALQLVPSAASDNSEARTLAQLLGLRALIFEN